MNIDPACAVHLLHRCALGTLATHTREPQGFPYPTVVPFAPDASHRPVILVSGLAEHTRNLVADPRTRPFFADADQRRVKAELIDQFCVILGGPCTYSGKSMKEAHAKLVINEAQFNALVEDLQKSMDKQGIPFRAQNKLLEKLAPMHREIINKQ